MKTGIFWLVAIIGPSAFATPFIPCDQDTIRQQARSIELQKIVAEDQADREAPVDKIDGNKVGLRDEARRKRIGEIFGEGCFKTAADYEASALVYQHGNIPDHYFQTFLWAKRAYELGDQKSKWLMAAGIDRYLVHSGRKQLFATQAGKSQGSPCWCLNQIESTFPAARRSDFGGKTVEQQLAWVHAMNEETPTCKSARFCSGSAHDSPAGTVPGFW